MSMLTSLGNDLYTGEKSFKFIPNRKLWLTIGLITVLVSILIPFLRGGFNFGIEFTGGTEFQVEGAHIASESEVLDAVQAVVGNQQVTVTTIGGNNFRIHTGELSETDRDSIVAGLENLLEVSADDVTINEVGGSWGADITSKMIRGLIVFVLLAGLALAVYFRTWRMSLAAMGKLLHDLIVTAGVYALTGFEVTPATVIGFLTILGYSLYDAVVVFDKVRENTKTLEKPNKQSFLDQINLAVNQTLVRSINTSVVAVLPVAAILFTAIVFLGTGTLRDISLALFVGILVATYSTLFIGSPLYGALEAANPQLNKGKAKKQ